MPSSDKPSAGADSLQKVCCSLRRAPSAPSARREAAPCQLETLILMEVFNLKTLNPKPENLIPKP